MRWHIFAIGKPKFDFARRGLEDYAARVKPFAPVEVHYVKASAAVDRSAFACQADSTSPTFRRSHPTGSQRRREVGYRPLSFDGARSATK